jgi:hypothetical protein
MRRIGIAGGLALAAVAGTVVGWGLSGIAVSGATPNAPHQVCAAWYGRVNAQESLHPFVVGPQLHSEPPGEYPAGTVGDYAGCDEVVWSPQRPGIVLAVPSPISATPTPAATSSPSTAP